MIHRLRRLKIGAAACLLLVSAIFAAPRTGSAAGETLFQQPAEYATGPYPYSAVATDLNTDGASDLLITDISEKTLSVLIGKGDGTFQPPQTIELGLKPRDVTAGDFNRDGNPDAAISIEETNQVMILKGNGDGTFQSPDRYSVGLSPAGLVTDDFNGDGFLDLAVANSSSGTISVLTGSGDGTFQPAAHYPVGFSPRTLVAGDFKHHGQIDLAVANNFSNNISVLINNGSGFDSATSLPTKGAPVGLHAADVNSDGNLDLLCASNADHEAVIYLGNVDGTFNQGATYELGPYPLDLILGDFDGDGKTDFLGSEPDRKPGILFGKGDGTFDQSSGLSLPQYPTLSAADLNGDGKSDIIFRSNSGIIVLNSAAEGELSLSSDRYEVDEDGGSVTVDIYRTEGSYGQTKVRLHTLNGTAAAGTDFAPMDETLVFQEGEASKSYSIMISRRSGKQEDRSFYVELESPTNGATLGATVKAEVVVHEAEDPPVSGDTEPPAWPGGATLDFSSVGKDRLTLSWPEAVDDTGTASYEVYQGTTLIRTTDSMTRSVTITGLSAGATYSFAVKALDAAGNKSLDLAASVTTSADPNSGEDPGSGTSGSSGSVVAPIVPSRSSESRLQELAISAGGRSLTLNPAFQSGVSEYSAETLEPRLVLNLKAMHGAAKIDINGEISSFPYTVPLVEGDNLFTIHIVAENGTKATYRLTVKRKPVISSPGNNSVESPSTPVDLQGHWAESDIIKAYKLGIVKGDARGAFRPDDSVTRAEWIVMLERMLGRQLGGAASFADLEQIPVWAQDAAKAASAQGIVAGFSDGTFRPNQSVTRAQTAVTLARAFGWIAPSAADGPSFADQPDIPAWAQPAVRLGTEKGLLKGRGSRFEPTAPLTRAEAAVLLVRATVLITDPIQSGLNTP